MGYGPVAPWRDDLRVGRSSLAAGRERVSNAARDEHGVPWTCRCGRVYRLSVWPMETHGSFGRELTVLPRSETIRGPSAIALDGFQIRVLRSIASGLTDREIAGSLRVSLHRVRYAVRELLAKLSARTRAEAVFVAVSSGLLDRDEAGLDADRPRPSIGSRA